MLQKYYPVMMLMILATFTAPAFGQSAYPPLEYMQNLTQPFEEIKGETWQYLKAATRGKSARKVEKKRQKLIDELRSSRLHARGNKSYEGDAQLKDAVVSYLELTYIVLKEDFDKILDMEEIAEQSYDKMEAYLLAKEMANQKLDSAGNIFAQAQRDFAEKHNITLLENEGDKTDQKIKKASDALGYYNDVYLIFFKCFKQEAYVLEALQRNDVMSLEQNKSALLSCSELGMQDLQKLENYQGDGMLKNAAKQMLSFYQKEAKNELQVYIDFYITKDNLEKIKNAVESKKSRDRTQEDIDRYNQAVEDFNNKVAEYNQVSESSNEKRSKALESWNEKVEAFFDRHAG